MGTPTGGCTPLAAWGAVYRSPPCGREGERRGTGDRRLSENKMPTAGLGVMVALFSSSTFLLGKGTLYFRHEELAVWLPAGIIVRV